MAYHRDDSPAEYDTDYTHNLRWRYRAGYGAGTYPEPYRGGGSFGRGYEWGEDRPPDVGEGDREGTRRDRTDRVHSPGPRVRSGRAGRFSGRGRRRGGRHIGNAYGPDYPRPEDSEGTRSGARGRRRRYPRRERLEAYGRRGYEGRYSPPGPYRNRLRRSWRPGTASRDYDRAYPYFASSAALEATSGYPPGDTLNPDAHPRGWTPDMTFYGDVY